MLVYVCVCVCVCIYVRVYISKFTVTYFSCEYVYINIIVLCYYMHTSILASTYVGHNLTTFCF
jgi:hypothetical protein